MSKNTRSPKRDVATILAEQEAKTEALRQRAAIAQAKDSEVLSPLFSEIKGCNKGLHRDSVLLGNSSAGCDSRRMSHVLWINVIDAEERVSQLRSDHTKNVKAFIQSAVSDLASQIADGADITQDDVQNILDNLPEVPEALEDAETKQSIAEDARAAHTAERKARKRANTAQG